MSVILNIIYLLFAFTVSQAAPCGCEGAVVGFSHPSNGPWNGPPNGPPASPPASPPANTQTTTQTTTQISTQTTTESSAQTSTQTTTQASTSTSTSTVSPSGAPTDGTVYQGKATYYYQYGATGSCGQAHSDNDLIVAVSETAPFVHNAYCGRTVTITNKGGGQDNNGVGKTVVALVADTCVGCTPEHLDLSIAAFTTLTGGPLDPPGTFDIEW